MTSDGRQVTSLSDSRVEHLFDDLFNVAGECEKREVGGGVNVILSRLVNDAYPVRRVVPLRFGYLVELQQLQRNLVALVTDAERVGRRGLVPLPLCHG